MYVAPEVAPANEAMAAGRYLEAGALYERSAISSYSAGEVVWQKMGALLAVKAYALGGDPQNAVRFAIATVDVLKTSGRAPEVPGFANKLLETLRTQGHGAAAEALSAHVGELIGAAWHDPHAPKLPAFCSACGGKVKPAEVVRPTPTTVACRYCGVSLDT
jgi:hypothetical protein